MPSLAALGLAAGLAARPTAPPGRIELTERPPPPASREHAEPATVGTPGGPEPMPAMPMPAVTMPSAVMPVVRAALPNGAVPQGVLPELAEMETVHSVMRHLEAVGQEVEGLRDELDLLRRRDETLSFYLHRLDEELRLAARLQQDFLPKTMPRVGPVRFHALFRPAGYVSGDLYDVWPLDERHVGFYLADAVGHGVPAALLTMFIRQAFVTREPAPGGHRLLDPGEALGRLNLALLGQNLSGATFATALYGIIDTDTLQVRMARAGHPAPLILRHGGPCETFEADGCLLGIFEEETFETRTAQLRPGDRLVLYTDGVEVAFAGGPAADPDRWRDELLRRRHLDPGRLLSDFARHLDHESGSLDPRDDLTMVVMEVKGEEDGEREASSD